MSIVFDGRVWHCTRCGAFSSRGPHDVDCGHAGSPAKGASQFEVDRVGGDDDDLTDAELLALTRQVIEDVVDSALRKRSGRLD